MILSSFKSLKKELSPDLTSVVMIDYCKDQNFFRWLLAGYPGSLFYIFCRIIALLFACDYDIYIYIYICIITYSSYLLICIPAICSYNENLIVVVGTPVLGGTANALATHAELSSRWFRIFMSQRGMIGNVWNWFASEFWISRKAIHILTHRIHVCYVW